VRCFTSEGGPGLLQSGLVLGRRRRRLLFPLLGLVVPPPELLPELGGLLLERLHPGLRLLQGLAKGGVFLDGDVLQGAGRLPQAVRLHHQGHLVGHGRSQVDVQGAEGAGRDLVEELQDAQPLAVHGQGNGHEALHLVFHRLGHVLAEGGVGGEVGDGLGVAGGIDPAQDAVGQLQPHQLQHLLLLLRLQGRQGGVVDVHEGELPRLLVRQGDGARVGAHQLHGLGQQLAEQLVEVVDLPDEAGHLQQAGAALLQGLDGVEEVGDAGRRRGRALSRRFGSPGGGIRHR
jgi:hypothetical protein